MTKELNIGVIGLGKMGLLHASIFNRIPHVKVKAICESKKLLTRFAKNAFPDLLLVNHIEELSRMYLDAAVVAVPIPVHSMVISALYRAGIHNLFVEKTLAENADESLAICQLTRKYSGVNMVGYMARFAVTFQKAKSLLDEGAIGEISFFHGYAYSSDFIGIPEKSYLRGGVIRDLGCHVIDLAQWFFGEIDITSASLTPFLPVNGENSALIKVKANNQVTGEFDISWCKEGYRMPDYGLMIRGGSGSVEVNNDMVKLITGNQQYIWNRLDLNDSVPFLLGAGEYYREDAAFVEAVINGSCAIPDFEMAARVDCFIDRAKTVACNGVR